MKKEDYLEIPEQKTFLQIRNVEAQKLLQEKFHHSVQDRLSDRKPARASQNAVSLAESECWNENERFPWEHLANAVIIQAVEDWRAAVRHLRKHPTSMAAKKCIRETETFFLSEYFTLLTNYNGHTLLRRLKEEFHTCQR